MTAKKRTDEQRAYVELVKDALRLQEAPKLKQSLSDLDRVSFIDKASMTEAQPVDAMSSLYKSVSETIINNLRDACPDDGKPLPIGFKAGEWDRRCLALLSSATRAQQYRDMILRSMPKVTNWVFEARGHEVWAKRVI